MKIVDVRERQKKKTKKRGKKRFNVHYNLIIVFLQLDILKKKKLYRNYTKLHRTTAEMPNLDTLSFALLPEYQ